MITTRLLNHHTHEYAFSRSEELGWKTWALDEVKKRIQCLGVDMSATPPMFYPEAITTLVYKWLVANGIDPEKAKRPDGSKPNNKEKQISQSGSASQT